MGSKKKLNLISVNILFGLIDDIANPFRVAARNYYYYIPILFEEGFLSLFSMLDFKFSPLLYAWISLVRLEPG